MPGNVLGAAPRNVLPQTLFTAFAEDREVPMLSNTYKDGTPERGLIQDGVNVPVSIRNWKVSKKLKAADEAALLTFFEGQQGGLYPFYFYIPFEIQPPAIIGSNFDVTGTNTVGRHIGVFRGDWQETTGLPRTVISLEIHELFASLPRGS